MNSLELKVQSKSLEAEAKFCRREENILRDRMNYHSERQDEKRAKALSFRRDMLMNYRRRVIREQALETFMARAILRDRPKKHILYNVRDGVITKEILENVVMSLRAYGNLTQTEAEERLTHWLESESTPES